MKFIISLFFLGICRQSYGQSELLRQATFVTFKEDITYAHPYVDDHYVAIDASYTSRFSYSRDSLIKYFTTSKVDKILNDMKVSDNMQSFPCEATPFVCVDSIFRRKLELNNLRRSERYYRRTPRLKYIILSFSKPIYMDEYAVIQVNTFAYNLNADSRLLLFKKNGKSWLFVTYLGSWAS